MSDDPFEYDDEDDTEETGVTVNVYSSSIEPQAYSLKRKDLIGIGFLTLSNIAQGVASGFAMLGKEFIAAAADDRLRDARIEAQVDQDLEVERWRRHVAGVSPEDFS